MKQLSPDSARSIKNSYFNILAMCSRQPSIDTRLVHCLLKWGFQLQLAPADLTSSNKRFEDQVFQLPETRLDRMEAIYHLIYMIHLDEVVEDVELELAAMYAAELGFRKETVADVLKAIETALYDDDRPHHEIRNEAVQFLNLHQG